MKQIKIPYKGKSICVTRDAMNYLLCVSLILFALFLSGAFNFAKFNFDFSKVGTIDFWLMYFLKTSISICLFFAIYIMRRVSNMKKASFITLKQDLKDEFTILHETKKINHMDFWLKYIYNYQKKLDIYKSTIQQLYHSSKEFEYPKSRFRFINKFRENKEHKKKNIRDFCEKEFKSIETHEELISAYREGDKQKITECKSKIKEFDNFSTTNIKWRNVYASNLFNDSKDKKNAETVFVNEKKEVTLQLFVSMMFMFVTYFAVTISILEFANGQSIFSAVLSIIMTLSIALSTCMFALRVADSVYEEYFTASKNKLKICYVFHEDLAKLTNDSLWEKGTIENEEGKMKEEKETIYD